jgi:hypothetical protein
MIPYAQRPRRLGGGLLSRFAEPSEPEQPSGAKPQQGPETRVQPPPPPQALQPPPLPSIQTGLASRGAELTQPIDPTVTDNNMQAAPRAGAGGNAQALAQAFTGSMNTYQPFADAAYTESTRRLDPQFAQADATFRQQMVNQGLSEGTEAYDKAFANFSRDKNDAYSSARNQSLAQALAAQGQAFGQDFGQQRADMSDLMGLLGYGNSVTQANNQTLNADQQRAVSLFGFIPGMSAQPLDVMGTANMYNNQSNFNQQSRDNRNNAYWQAAGQLGSAFLGGG